MSRLIALIVMGWLVGTAQDGRSQAIPGGADRVIEPAADSTDGLTASDQDGIRQAFEVWQHTARPVDGGYRASNPGQGWSTFFHGRGFTTSPTSGPG